ncbi:MAG: MFS transporter [Planctomycetota bacterium]
MPKSPALARSAAASRVLLAATFYLFLLASFYVLRPVREEIGADQEDVLAWLQTFTFLGMLVAVPLYSALVARFPRRRFISWTYQFFALNLVGFFLVWRFVPAEDRRIEERVFFVWHSVYNLFIVAVFWSFMADLHRAEEAKRRFGLIAVGGTIGGILGAQALKHVVASWGAPGAFLAALALLEVANLCAWILDRRARNEAAAAAPGPSFATFRPAGGEADRPLGGSVLEGFRTVLRSPYLLMISLYIAVQSLVNTFAYFEQAKIVKAALPGEEERLILFANMDVAVNAITLALQLLVVSRVMRRFGVQAAIVVMPLLAVAGFALLGTSPTLPVVVGLMVALRCARYGMTKPAREVLFTVVPRADKYKAKAFVDTVLYRGGDTAAGWAFAGLEQAKLGLAAIALGTVPIAAGWVFVGRYLGRRQQALAEEQGPRDG